MAMINEVNHLWFSLFILISIFAISRAAEVKPGGDDPPDCVYTIYVQTGSKVGSGTNSNITLSLYDASNVGISIKNLETWGGLMGPGYDYFESGNLDIFTGTGPCLKGPVCAMILASNGSGSHPRWYVNSVEVTVTGVCKACSQQLFKMQQWLGPRPYQLTAIRDYCNDHVVIDDESGSSSHVGEE